MKRRPVLVVENYQYFSWGYCRYFPVRENPVVTWENPDCNPVEFDGFKKPFFPVMKTGKT